MVVFLSGTLVGGGSLFGNHKFPSPLLAEIGLASDYWLIFAYLPPLKGTPEPLDIGQLMNSAFNMGLDNLHILVKNTGFFQLSASSGAVTYDEIVKQFPFIPFPEDPELQQQALENLVCFWAEIEFKSWDIGTSLISIGGKNDDHDILKLYGFYASSKEVKSTQYVADFPDFTLFEIFEFSGIQFRYLFNVETLYSLKGQLTINAFDLAFIFKGIVQKQKDRFFAGLSIDIQSKAKTISNPFGGEMTGVTFTSLQFGILRQVVPPSKNEINNLSWFQGSVDYSVVGLTGGIYLEDSTPILALIKITKDLDVGEIFKNSIPGFTWPTEFINIVFKAGCNLYYLKQGYDKQRLTNTGLSLLDIQGNPVPVTSVPLQYEDGFSIYTDIDLTIWKTISFTGNFNIKTNGVSAEIQLKQVIDIYVLQITAPSHLAGIGPIFKVSTISGPGVSPYIQFKGGINFFESDFGVDVDVMILKIEKETGIIATISTQDSYAIFNNQPVKLTVTYSKSKGFAVKDWPAFALAEEIIDFISAIKKMAKTPSGGCSAVAGEITSKAINTNFKVTPTFETTEDTLYFVISVSFSITCFGQDLGTIDFPGTLKFAVTAKKLSDLPDMIINAIKSVPEQFVQALYDNAEAMAKVLAIVMAEQALNIAAKMICQGLENSSFTQLVEAALHPVPPPPPPGPPPPPPPGPPPPPPPPPGPPPGPSLSPPNITSFVYADQHVTMAWDSVKDATGYQFQLLDPSGQPVGNTVDGPGLNASADVSSPLLPAGNYTGQVRATAGSTQSGWSQRTIEKLALPAHAALSYDADKNQLVVGWDAVSGASGYDFVLLLNNAPKDSKSVAGSPVTYDALTLDAGTYNTRITASGDASHISSSPAAADVSIIKPESPTQVTFTARNNQLLLSWQAPANAAGYDVQLLQGTTVIQSRHTADLNYAFDVVPGTYTASVRLTGTISQLPSSWQTAPDPASKLAAPADIKFSYDHAGQQFQATWLAVTGNSGYVVQVIDVSQPDKVLYTANAATDSISLNIPLSALTTSAEKYGLQISTKGSATAADSSFGTAPQQITRIAPVTSVDFSFNLTKGAFVSGWPAVTGNNGYQVQVFNEATPTVIVANLPAAIDATSLEIPIAGLMLPAGNYLCQVQVIGQADVIDSAFVVSVQKVLKLGVTALQQATFLNNLVTANWTALTGAVNYTFRVIKDQEQLSQNTSDLSTTLIASTLSSGTYNAQVMATGDQTVIPGDWCTAIPVAIAPLTMDALAAKLFTEKDTAVQAGQKIIAAFPNPDPTLFAVALAKAGYPALDTTEALKAYFPGLTAAQLTTILRTAYGAITPNEFAIQCKQAGMTALQTGVSLVTNYPGIDATTFAVALAGAGFPVDDTSNALKAQFPGLTAAKLVTILHKAYGSMTANEFAIQCKRDGMDAVQAGTNLVANYPGINATAFAIALAGAGYLVNDTTNALKNSFPQLTPQQFVTAIRAAYPS